MSQYGQVLYIIKTYLAEGSYDTNDYLELNLDPVFYQGYDQKMLPVKEQNLKVLQYELSKIKKPISSTFVTERIDQYQKLQKVISFNLAFEIQRSSPSLSKGVRCMQMTARQLGLIKNDVKKSKQSVYHLKDKIAANTKQALLQLGKKKLLVETKRIITTDLIRFKESLAEVKRLIQEGLFVEAIKLCDKATANVDPDSITGRLEIM